MKRVVVTGAGGFIGGHLVGRLLLEGARVRAVDAKPLDEWWRHHPVEEMVADLSRREACETAITECDELYALACDMGGIGFIENNRAACSLSVLTSTHTLQAARGRVGRLFYSSSACIYPVHQQGTPEAAPLRESDAYPAMPEDGYGWEKLFTERMCRHFREDYGLETRIARYHNAYGPHGAWTGGREKSPAAICRKVAEAVIAGSHDIVIWGDGTQRRSYMYIDDCVEGTLRICRSDVVDPLNLGSDESVTVNELVSTVEDIAGTRLHRTYDPSAPKGVAGRNSDNTLIREKLGWAPSTRLIDGLQRTYAWIYDQVKKAGQR